MDALRRSDSYRVIFMAKTSLDVCILRREHVWTFPVLGDHNSELKRVTETGQQFFFT